MMKNCSFYILLRYLYFKFSCKIAYMAKVNKIHIFADVSKYIIKLINDQYKNIQHALL